MNEKPSPLEVYTWDGLGYQPLLFSDGWQVAILNWEPAADFAQCQEIERHANTDEVFVLLRGQALLFVSAAAGTEQDQPGHLHCENVLPGVIYNVPRGVWHNLIATRDASWLIVENRDTHLHDCEIRPLTAAERQDLQQHLPEWAK